MTLVRMAWAAPCSVLGLALALPVVLTGGSARRVGHTLEVSLRPAPARKQVKALRITFAAITLGHVIVGRSSADLAQLRRHERVHVRQYEHWGPLFLLAYPLASLLALVKGKHPYLENYFERQAYREAGGE